MGLVQLIVTISHHLGMSNFPILLFNMVRRKLYPLLRKVDVHKL